MIKKIRIEVTILIFIILNIVFSSLVDVDLYKRIYDLNETFKNEYYWLFFVKITELGNSLWFFLFSLLVYIFCFLFEKTYEKKLIITKIKLTSLFFFSSLLVTGVLTQIIKHIIGRPRPNYESEADFLGINFFNFDSAFHSFPSGHTSTIFIVALVLSLITPRIKYFYFLCAFIISLSRVVVGAHYFADVIGGIVISFIGLKITFWIFNEIKSKTNILEEIQFRTNKFFISLIIFFIIIIFLAVGSPLDIFVGNLFYKGGQVFVLQSFSYITILAREVFLPFVAFYILIIPILSLFFPLKIIYFGFNFNYKQIIFLWTSMLINVVVVVNVFLKGFWGRARPNDILELGGSGVFTPWYKISDSCNSNCSFVSGDSSVGFSLIILFFITNNKVYFWMALFSGLFLGGVRIFEGAHFLSDIVASGFLIFCLTYVQSTFYKKIFINES